MPDDDLEEFDFVLSSEHPEAVIALLHHLSSLRSQHIVGRKLAEKYATDVAWIDALKSREFIELVEEFAQCVSDIRTAAELGQVVSPEVLQKAVGQHYSRALAAVQEFSELVEVPATELLATLIQA
jgi:hypothetical protein